MPEPTPTGLAVVQIGSVNTVSWTNADDYDHVVLWKATGTETISSYVTVAGPMVSGTTSSYDDSQITPYNTPHRYAVKAYRNPFDPSDLSSEVQTTRFTDTETATVTLTATETDVYGASDTLTATLTLTAVETDTAGMSETITATLTLTATTADATTLRTDFGYYLGDAVGGIYKYSPAYLSDNGTSIGSTWRSKTIDFAEQGPDNSGKWKVISKIEVFYVDKTASTPVVVRLSNDGGATWTTSTTHYCGTGSGKTEIEDFWFIMTGQFFIMEISWAGTAHEFQFLGCSVEYDDTGETWNA